MHWGRQRQPPPPLSSWQKSHRHHHEQLKPSTLVTTSRESKRSNGPSVSQQPPSQRTIVIIPLASSLTNVFSLIFNQSAIHLLQATRERHASFLSNFNWGQRKLLEEGLSFIRPFELVKKGMGFAPFPCRMMPNKRRHVSSSQPGPSLAGESSDRSTDLSQHCWAATTCFPSPVPLFCWSKVDGRGQFKPDMGLLQLLWAWTLGLGQH